jgi:hypothetical protein
MKKIDFYYPIASCRCTLCIRLSKNFDNICKKYDDIQVVLPVMHSMLPDTNNIEIIMCREVLRKVRRKYKFDWKSSHSI